MLAPITIDNTLGLGDPFLQPSVRVWPNPAQTGIWLKTNNLTVFSAVLLSAQGQLVQTITPADLQEVIAVDALPNGIYYLKIVDMKDSLVFNYTFTGADGKQHTEKNSMRIYDNGNKLSFDSAQFDIVDTRRRGIRLTLIAERAGAENFRSADFQETIILGPGMLNYTKGIRYMDMTDAYFIRKRVILTKK